VRDGLVDHSRESYVCEPGKSMNRGVGGHAEGLLLKIDSAH
jgi:hypothetical protein